MSEVKVKEMIIQDLLKQIREAEDKKVMLEGAIQGINLYLTQLELEKSNDNKSGREAEATK